MEIPLHFGSDFLTLEIPEDNVADIIRPRQFEFEGSNSEILSKVIEANQAQFEQRIHKGVVGLLVPDGTRDLPLEDMLPLLLPSLKNAKKVLVFICTGSHDAQTPANSEIVRIIKSQVIQAEIVDYEIISHDCQKAVFSNGGMTTYGTEVLYNSRLDEVDAFCIISDIKHHYFAGYSNPVKNIVPGLCAYETIEKNHSLTFDDHSRAGVHPWHPDSSRRDNPLANDQYEAMQSIVQNRPVWALTTISQSGKIQWADFGSAKEISAKAFLKADEWNMRTTERVDYLIVSPGGLPNDVDLYIAQRALELTTSVVRDGGEVLFLAACPAGIGSELTKEHFEKQLTKPLVQILAQKQSRYHLFSHKPYRFATLIQRLEKLWLYTEISPFCVKNIHMAPCDSLRYVISKWLTCRPDAKILIVDGANKLLLRNSESE
jgi:nickel-dependent lactate racemase